MKIDEMQVLQLLKNGLYEAARAKGQMLTENDFGSKRWNNSEKRVFYLLDKRKNLFDIPNPKTKLGTGVEAVRSSAAMIFNLLGEKDFIFEHKNYSGIEYEKKLPAIVDEKGETHEAHLDAVFYSSDKSEMYAVEAKLLEWKDSPKNLAKAYLEEGRYLIGEEDRNAFIAFFKSLIQKDQLDKDDRYKHRNKRYDAIQMTIHTLALYTYFSRETMSAVKKLTLLNVVWKYECDEYSLEEEEAKHFIKDANERFTHLFKQIGIDFSIRYFTFQDFKERIVFSNDPLRLKYLKRYEIK